MRRKAGILLGVLAFGCMLVIAVATIVKNVGTAPTSQPVATATPTTTATPLPTSTATPESAKQLPSQREVVRAAATEFVALSEAQFLPPDLLERTVQQTAAPGARAKLVEGLTSTGPYLTNLWGYDSMDDVLANGYNVEVQQYRIKRLTSSRAVVSLYTLSRWATKSVSQNSEGESQVVTRKYRAPGFNVVKLRKANGHWLYVSRQDPPAEEAPIFEADKQLSYSETVRLYQPYLKKGYKSYVALANG